jgi:hypothetical protein
MSCAFCALSEARTRMWRTIVPAICGENCSGASSLDPVISASITEVKGASWTFSIQIGESRSPHVPRGARYGNVWHSACCRNSGIVGRPITYLQPSNCLLCECQRAVFRMSSVCQTAMPQRKTAGIRQKEHCIERIGFAVRSRRGGYLQAAAPAVSAIPDKQRPSAPFRPKHMPVHERLH